jgi:predicted amidohydrolase
MTEFPTVRVAALQATPVILDAEATLDKTVRLLAEAAAEGVRLAVLPETFISIYPSNVWAHRSATFGGSDELWERMWESSVEVPGPVVERLTEACRKHDLHCALGVNEREAARPGTLYNTLLLIGPAGLLWKHRKLMPTLHERVFHGIGAGDDLDVTETPVGRIGGLICWENRMPLARWEVYRGGPQIWIAPTADDSDGWQASMRHIALESGAFVVAAPQFIPRSAFPADFPLELPDKEVLGNGGAVIVDPEWGEVIAGPLYGKEGMVVADCDLRRGLHAKRWFDAVGHYGRTDALAPPALTADGAESRQGITTWSSPAPSPRSAASARRRTPR